MSTIRSWSSLEWYWLCFYLTWWLLRENFFSPFVISHSIVEKSAFFRQKFFKKNRDIISIWKLYIPIWNLGTQSLSFIDRYAVIIVFTHFQAKAWRNKSLEILTAKQFHSSWDYRNDSSKVILFLVSGFPFIIS